MRTKYSMSKIKSAMRLIRAGVSYEETSKSTGIPAGSLTSILKRAEDSGIRVRAKRLTWDDVEIKPKQVQANLFPPPPPPPPAGFEDQVLEILTMKHCTKAIKAKMIALFCGATDGN